MAEPMTRLDDSALSLNLSYVLHEASDSRTVQRASRDSQRFSRRKNRIRNSAQTLGDPDFSNSVFIIPELLSKLETIENPVVLLTASVGLPDLLRRAFKSTGLFRSPEALPEPIKIDGAVPSHNIVHVQFFKARARMLRPQMPFSARTAIVAGLMVRPDEKSLLLTGDVVNLDLNHGSDGMAYSPRVIAALEGFVRDYVDQWTPERELWEEPAEAVLPELQTGDRST